MVVFPFAKINLGLHVLRKRPDGYRDIETVLLPIPLCDVLEVVVDEALPAGQVVLERTGLPVPGDPLEDLCVRAARALHAKHPLPGLRMHLHKVIPIGAGLGGGSSDGAHALKLINSMLGLGLGQTDLLDMAAQLGSDCPFFLGAGAQLATGRGEVLTPVDLDLHGWWLMLIDPGIHISTAEVYANTGLAPARADLADLVLRNSPEEWSGRLVNVMEEHVLNAYRGVAEAKHRLEATGATYASMSGSGSSVFGIFRDKPVVPLLPHGQRSWMWQL